MNKKTIRIAGWALGLSMAVAGIGAAVSASFVANGNEPIMVAAEDVSDTLTAGLFAATSTTYTDFSGVSVTSGAVYAGNNGKTSNGGIQLRSKNSNSGIVSTTSGGKVKAVSVTVESGSNTFDIYGSNTAYTSAADLYNNTKQGTKIGSGSGTGSVTLSSTDYEYIGIRSNNGALYLSNIVITWVQEASIQVSFNSNGGSESPESINVEENGTFEFPSAGTKVGYIFAGWSNDGGETKHAAGSTSAAVTAATTYTAYWTEDPIDTVTISKGSFKQNYYAGDAWDWESLLVACETESGAEGSPTDLASSNFSFSPAAPAIGVTSVTVTVTYGGKTSDALIINDISVSEAPLSYTITGPAQSQGGSTAASLSGLNDYFPIEEDYYVEWTGASGSAYVSNGYAMKFGTSTDSATGTVTLSLKEGAPIYFTGVILNAKGWSDGTETLKVNNSDTQAISASGWSDYEFDVSSEATSITIGNGSKRVSVYSIEVLYAYKAPELHASSTSVEAVVNTNTTTVNLTYDNFTPTAYEAEITGSSVTAVEFDTAATPHTATFTTHATITGESVVRITGSVGGKEAYVDVTVMVTQPRNLVGLEITNDSDATTFKVGQAFDIGSLVVTATFDSAPTTVVYSKAANNLGALSFDPEIGHVFGESDIGVVTVAIGLEVGTGSDIVGYDITVNDKDYATLVTSISDLWDGQQVYFSNNTSMTVNKYTSGNNVGSSPATFDPTKGLDVAGTNGYAYTVERVKYDDATYYLFALEDGGNTYYLKDNGTSGNYLARTDDRTDEAIYWSISAGEESGQWTITNKSVAARPNLQINGSLLACYNNTQTDPYLYKLSAYDAASVASSFEANRMHMNDYDPTLSGATTGWCKDSEHGYYASAKAVWNAMSTEERTAVSANAKARLSNWAAAVGDNYDGGNGTISASRNALTPIDLKLEDSKFVVILSSAMAGVAILAGAFLVQRKRRFED